MRSVIFLPGCMGTNLHYIQSGELVKLWVDVNRLRSGYFRKMRLNAAGDAPGTGGALMEDGVPLQDTYQAPLDLFEKQLKDIDFLLRTFPYDWRESLTTAASILRSQIHDRYTEEDPVTLVCHSQGGLIARLAYRELKIDGEHEKVRKIITLGTPHLGTYNPCLFWWLRNKDAKRLVRGSQTSFGTVAYTETEVAQIAATWPALYQMLPFITDAQMAIDPNREQLYSPAAYPAGVEVSQQHLNSARAIVQARLADPNSRPPGDQLVTVGAYGQPTAYALPLELLNPSPFAVLEGLAWVNLLEDDRGDGCVTLASALVPGSQQMKTYGDHQSVFAGGVYGEWLAKLVKEDPTSAEPVVAPAAPITDTHRVFTPRRAMLHAGEFTSTIPQAPRTGQLQTGGPVRPTTGTGVTGVSARPR